MKYRTIVIDPPYPQPMTGSFKSRHSRPKQLPYKPMTLEQIKSLDIAQYAEAGSHLWLWTTNKFLRAGFDILDEWGFTYLAPITWVKPSGLGAWFAHTTQTILFAYYQKCQFNKQRWLPTHFFANVYRNHSKKPEESYKIVEKVSDESRIEIFAREERPGYYCIGDELGKPIEIKCATPEKECVS